MNSAQDNTISRRKQKKKAAKLNHAQSSAVRAKKDAAIRNSRSRRFHRTLSKPGRGGLTAKGAAQLQRFFSKKAPESEKPSLRELDSTAILTLSQILFEEVDVQDGLREKLAQATRENMMTNAVGEEGGQGREGEEEMLAEQERGMGKVEMEVEEKVLGEEDEEQGGVVLANDL
ncbi:MAG: hypothetical protein Q9161_006770 [Pseudevernia consocians]